MNTDPQPAPLDETSSTTPVILDESDEFAGEVLGERQPDACNLEEGCERCQ